MLMQVEEEEGGTVGAWGFWKEGEEGRAQGGVVEEAEGGFRAWSEDGGGVRMKGAPQSMFR